MELQTPLIFGCIFLIASLALFFVYKFGIKEKSYEEALAEQRQQTQALLGVKPKPKEKKSKKSAKKVKEKQNSDNEIVQEEQQEVVEQRQKVSTTQIAPQHHKNLHVEFKEEPEELPTKEVITPPKKRVKKEKVRPILISKDNPTENIIIVGEDEIIPPANHFEDIHPKDEFELYRSNSSDELLKGSESGGKSLKGKHQPASQEQEIVKTVSKKLNKDPPPENTTQNEKAKEEKRNEAPNPAASNGLVNNVGKEKKKKKSEFNTLQQLTAGDGSGANMSILLNLVRKAELSRSEVQILIDLLLNKQHEAPAIVDEWSEGKSDPVQKLKKQLAEKENLLAEEQQALLGAQAKLREVRAEQQAERSQLQQKVRGFDELLQNKQVEVGRLHQQLQQLQGQLKEELLKGHKIREELGSMQMQRQQFEMRIAQTQEAEVVIAQLQNDNQQLRLELKRLSDENVAEKETNQTFLVRLSNFQKELELKSEHIRKIEENRVDTEHKVEKYLRQENDFKMEISRLNSVYQQQNEELRRIELGKKQYQDEVYRLQTEKDESDRLIAQLRTDLQQIIEEKSQLQAAQANGAVEENKAREVELLNLHNELASVKSQLQQTGKNYENEIQMMNATIEKLRNELQEQKEKNNDLRTRNWKVMEALNVAESRIKSNNTSNSHSDQIKVTQETSDIEFIQRLFPEIKALKEISPEVFHTESEKHIRKFIENLQKQNTGDSSNNTEVKKMESQIQCYQKSIDNAEKILVNLQKHIEKEELTWRAQLDAKTKEVEALKASISASSQLKEEVLRLETELEEERDKRTKIVEEFEKFKNDKNSSTDSSVIDRLSQEVDRLREQLREHNKNGDINSKNCNSTNGPALLEYCVSSSSSIASSLGDFSVTKSKSKKKKKKESTN